MSVATAITSPRTHLAVVHQHYLRKILNGTKTIESRFSKVRCHPYAAVAPGDLILFKPPGGVVVAKAHAASVLFFDELDEDSFRRIFERHGDALQLDSEFLEAKRFARYCTLVFLADVAPTPPLRFPKRDRRGWVILPSEVVVDTVRFYL